MTGHVFTGPHVSHVTLSHIKSHSFPLDPDHIQAEHHLESGSERSLAGDKRRRWGGSRAEMGRGAARQRSKSGDGSCGGQEEAEGSSLDSDIEEQEASADYVKGEEI